MPCLPRFVLMALAGLLVLALAIPVLAEHELTEQAEPTAAEALERMDRTLAPIDARIASLLTDIGATDGEMSKAYTSILAIAAVEAWDVVAATPVHACYAQLAATLRVTYALLADSVDSYQLGDPAWGTEVAAAMHLWTTQVPLERSATTCDPQAAQTPTPVEQAPQPSVAP